MSKSLTRFSKEFKSFFLLHFTRELIKHSASGEIFELEKVLKLEKELKKEKEQFTHPGTPKVLEGKVKEKIKQLEKPLEKLEIKEKRVFKPVSRPPIVRHPRVLRIPEPRLPPHLQYLRPVPVDVPIELGKLNVLIKDPAVGTIECNGADEQLIVSGTMGTKKTNIVLNQEEISDVINKFSSAAKIPIHEGIFRIVVGRLILTAIVSEVVSPKFTIRKMGYGRGF